MSYIGECVHRSNDVHLSHPVPTVRQSMLPGRVSANCFYTAESSCIAWNSYRFNTQNAIRLSL